MQPESLHLSVEFLQGTSPCSFCTTPCGCGPVGPLRAARRVCSASGAPSGCPSCGLSPASPLALGHLVAFSAALPLSVRRAESSSACRLASQPLAVLAAQHHVHHPPPSQHHGGCSQHPAWDPGGRDHPRLQDSTPPAPSIVPRPAGKHRAELGVAFKAEAWGRRAGGKASPPGSVAVMFPNTSSCVQCVLQVFLQRSGLFLQCCLYKRSRMVPTCFWHLQTQVGCVYPGDWPQLQSSGAQPAA